MKRDMDLMRRILVRVGEAEGPVDAKAFVDERYSESCVCYHVQMLEAHGLVDANVKLDAFDEMIYSEITALTWDGCDYLDAIMDDRVWKRTKELVKSTVGHTTLDVIKQAAVKVALHAIETGLAA